MKFIRETSDAVCKQMCRHAYLTDNINILEPSCGDGKIVNYILDHYNLEGVRFDMVELNKERLANAKANVGVSILRRKEIAGANKKENLVQYYQKDFLEWEPNGVKGYDLIIACPPFKHNIDIVHIQKMYKHLSYKGMLVSLTSPLWITNNEHHQVEFRKWLEEKQYHFEMLPDNSFIEKGRSVSAGILTIRKAHSR